MSVVPQLVVNSLIAAGTYALIAIGFNLIYGATKFFNMAHGVMAAIGGYTVFFLTTTYAGINVVGAAILGILVAAAIGWGLDRIIYRPLRKRHASNMVLLVASLGAFTIIQAAIAMIFTSQFQTLSSAVSERVYQVFGASITETQVIILASVILVFVLLSLFLKVTMFGKQVRAVSDDEEVARIAGINTGKVIGWIFFIGSAIAGLGGVLIGFDTGIQPTMGLSLLLKGVIAAIVGGIGSISGAILGALLLGFAENFGIW
jgi:branched-subunit amino acid ABC-type transport system permease component